MSGAPVCSTLFAKCNFKTGVFSKITLNDNKAIRQYKTAQYLFHLALIKTQNIKYFDFNIELSDKV